MRTPSSSSVTPKITIWPGTPVRSCHSSSIYCDEPPRYATVGYGTVGSIERALRECETTGSVMGTQIKKPIKKPTAVVVDTQRPSIAGVHRPAWKALRAVFGQITTPLLPDDYLQLANPLWSARELRGRVLEVRRETTDSATLVIKPGLGFTFDYQPGQYIGIGLLVDGRWRWRSYSLTSSPVTR